jgi:hypothetical protein
MDNITELFCQIDDFCKSFEPNLNKKLIAHAKSSRNRAASISLSELMTIAVLFHQLRFRQFKAFYCDPCRESRTLSYGIIKQPSACNSEMLGLD